MTKKQVDTSKKEELKDESFIFEAREGFILVTCPRCELKTGVPTDTFKMILEGHFLLSCRLCKHSRPIFTDKQLAN